VYDKLNDSAKIKLNFNIDQVKYKSDMSQNIKVEDYENKVVGTPVPVPVSVLVILDTSGSMSSMGTEPVDGINNFFEDQNKSGEFYATLALFNENTTILYQNVKGCDIKPLTKEDYIPNGMTGLYDAIGKVIVIQKEIKTENVIVLIVTDGHENASREYNQKTTKTLITEMETKYNWKFIYLGANQDSFSVGNSIGITTSADYEYTPLGCRKMMKEVSDSISRCISHEVPIDNMELKVDQTFKNKKRKFDDSNTLPPSCGLFYTP
jgi:Mg-chelatase subunit ChlD